jgi:hypothetical protein
MSQSNRVELIDIPAADLAVTLHEESSGDWTTAYGVSAFETLAPSACSLAKVQHASKATTASGGEHHRCFRYARKCVVRFVESRATHRDEIAEVPAAGHRERGDHLDTLSALRPDKG